jgi:hypothetical protein
LEFFKFIGDEVFGHIMSEALVRPYDELFINSNTPRYNISRFIKIGLCMNSCEEDRDC